MIGRLIIVHSARSQCWIVRYLEGKRDCRFFASPAHAMAAHCRNGSATNPLKERVNAGVDAWQKVGCNVDDTCGP